MDKTNASHMHIFDNIDDALIRLSHHSKGFQLPLRKELGSQRDVVNFSVGQNIFRALGIDGHKPSEVYRSWATINFESLHRQLSECQNQIDFDHIINSFTDSLLVEWTKATKGKLIYGPASKMVNLLIKTIQESSEFRINSIIPYQHVPWDSYTLRPLKNIINELITTNYQINIPTSASMSFVNSKELYNILQDAIFKLYSHVEEKPSVIHFDYFAWNGNHTLKKSLVNYKY